MKSKSKNLENWTKFLGGGPYTPFTVNFLYLDFLYLADELFDIALHVKKMISIF